MDSTKDAAGKDRQIFEFAEVAADENRPFVARVRSSELDGYFEVALAPIALALDVRREREESDVVTTDVKGFTMWNHGVGDVVMAQSIPSGGFGVFWDGKTPLAALLQTGFENTIVNKQRWIGPPHGTVEWDPRSRGFFRPDEFEIQCTWDYGYDALESVPWNAFVLSKSGEWRDRSKSGPVVKCGVSQQTFVCGVSQQTFEFFFACCSVLGYDKVTRESNSDLLREILVYFTSQADAVCTIVNLYKYACSEVSSSAILEQDCLRIWASARAGGPDCVTVDPNTLAAWLFGGWVHECETCHCWCETCRWERNRKLFKNVYDACYAGGSYLVGYLCHGELHGFTDSREEFGGKYGVVTHGEPCSYSEGMQELLDEESEEE